MDELIDRAVQVWFDGGDANVVWNVLNHLYATFGDPVEVHVAVLDGSDAVINKLMKI